MPGSASSMSCSSSAARLSAKLGDLSSRFFSPSMPLTSSPEVLRPSRLAELLFQLVAASSFAPVLLVLPDLLGDSLRVLVVLERRLVWPIVPRDVDYFVEQRDAPLFRVIEQSHRNTDGFASQSQPTSSTIGSSISTCGSYSWSKYSHSR